MDDGHQNRTRGEHKQLNSSKKRPRPTDLQSQCFIFENQRRVTNRPPGLLEERDRRVMAFQ